MEEDRKDERLEERRQTLLRLKQYKKVEENPHCFLRFLIFDCFTLRIHFLVEISQSEGGETASLSTTLGAKTRTRSKK